MQYHANPFLLIERVFSRINCSILPLYTRHVAKYQDDKKSISW